MMRVHLSPSATHYLLELCQQQGSVRLRVSIEGGGCNGFQYRFELDPIFQADDMSVETDQALLSDCQIVSDPLSLQYLQGAHIDYVRCLQGAQFKVTNPAAKTTCSCGASFSI